MTVQEKLDKIETMEDLFSLSIDITKGLINVATLAYVKNVSLDKSEKYYNVDVKPFPLKEDQEEYELSCYCNNRIGEKLKEKDIVIVLFTDLDFRSSLNNNTINSVNDEECHDINSGVIISWLWMDDEPD